MSAPKRRRRAPGAALGVALLLVGLGVLLLLPAGEPESDPGGVLPADGEAAPARVLEREPIPGPGLPDRRIRVEVLNAGGVAGMAARATDHLRGAGFDVVYYGNARAFGREHTVVLDRAGDPAAARAVARALGVEEIQESPDPGLLVEVTVLLGSGWVVPPPAGPDGGGEEGAWWSPRALLDRMRSLD